MLHKINYPNCRTQLEKILEFQQQVLEMVCDPAISLPLQETEVKQRFSNQDIGDWLWKRLWNYGNPKNGKSKFHKYLKETIVEVQKNPSVGQSVVDAFRNDVSFNQNLNDATFQFSFPSLNLEENLSKAIKNLMEAFYEDLLRQGFPACVHQGQENFSRASFLKEFWQAELGVCPACDGQRPDSIEGEVRCHVDHFFPKAHFPFLSIHPANLIPICHECNASFKGEKIPIDINNNESLLDTFHPYERPAIEYIDVETNIDTVGKLRVIIRDRQRQQSKRVDNLNNILSLEKRWTDRLRREIGLLRDQIVDEGRKENITDKTREDLENILINILDTNRITCNERKSKHPNYVIQSSYVQYAMLNNDELDVLVDQFLRR